MQIEGIYRGPLMDTIIQRFRDPVDGSICYLYVPIEAEHSVRRPTGYVVYGSNTIGAISCFPAAPAAVISSPPAAQAPQRAPKPPPRVAPAQ